MPNLSQEKRQRMLAYLDKIKEEHKNNDEILIALGEIENELTSKNTVLCGKNTKKKLTV